MKYQLRSHLQRLLILYWVFFSGFSTILYAQSENVTGKVIDATTSEPLPGATVYINGTSYGTTTSKEGMFQLINFPELPFELTVSYLGYATTTISLIEQPQKALLISLSPREYTLPEVTVTAEKEGWKKYGSEFIVEFIGYSPFARKCKILNPDALIFTYDPNNLVLSIRASEALLIRNEALGYEIEYWLEYFEKDYQKRMLSFSGTSLFTDLKHTTRSKRKKKRWDKNRRYAYDGSLMHFVRSLQKRTYDTEGFEVRALQLIPKDQLYSTKEIHRDTLNLSLPFETQIDAHFKQYYQQDSSLKSVNRHFFLQNVSKWIHNPQSSSRLRTRFVQTMESIYQFEFNKQSSTTALIPYSSFKVDPEIEASARGGFIARLYDTPVSPDYFVVTSTVDSTQHLRFPDFLHITYVNELEEKAYLERKHLFKTPKPAEQVSIISLNNQHSVRLFENGNFAPAYGLLIEDYWSYEKMDKLLPLDYMKEND